MEGKPPKPPIPPKGFEGGALLDEWEGALDAGASPAVFESAFFAAGLQTRWIVYPSASFTSEAVYSSFKILPL